jgi:hypothetical protein
MRLFLSVVTVLALTTTTAVFAIPKGKKVAELAKTPGALNAPAVSGQYSLKGALTVSEPKVNPFLKALFAYIEAGKPDEIQEVYRKSGSSSEVQRIFQKILTEYNTPQTFAGIHDFGILLAPKSVDDAAGAVKELLSKARMPLIGPELATALATGKPETVTAAITALKPETKNILKQVIDHLVRIKAQSKMPNFKAFASAMSGSLYAQIPEAPTSKTMDMDAAKKLQALMESRSKDLAFLLENAATLLP